MPAVHFVEIRKLILKLIQKCKEPRIANIPQKQGKSRDAAAV
jgi:hypothetical protein